MQRLFYTMTKYDQNPNNIVSLGLQDSLKFLKVTGYQM